MPTIVSFKPKSGTMWAAPCENGQRMSRSACLSAQSDRNLRGPLTEILDTIECINGEQMPG